MVGVLESLAGGESGIGKCSVNKYITPGISAQTNYTTFAEMYLEKQLDVTAGITCSICTFRGIPTIDDW